MISSRDDVMAALSRIIEPRQGQNRNETGKPDQPRARVFLDLARRLIRNRTFE